MTQQAQVEAENTCIKIPVLEEELNARYTDYAKQLRGH
nr:hypothetical protein BAR15_180079 [Bartonella sp. AR 15-3]